MLRKIVQRLARPAHIRSRTQKMRLFSALFSSCASETLLDVGGGLGIAGEFKLLYRHFPHVVVANLEIPSAEGILPNMEYVNADGCRLPFKDKSFDWVFSNAVIEHVGSYDRQREFAFEIRRVAMNGYFVTTPNRYFPIEPHALLPFYQFLPTSWQRRIVRFSPGYLQTYEEINLLSAAQMKELFPEAQVTQAGFPKIGSSLVACSGAKYK